MRWQLTALRRGVHALGPLELEAGDPLGFFTRRTLAAAPELLVFPRLVPLSAIALPRREFVGTPGVYNPVEDPAYVHGIRPYYPGHSARYIHWKASARHNRLVEKNCEPTANEKLLLVVQADYFDGAARAEVFERCQEVVASLAVRFDAQRCAVGLATNARLKGRSDDAVEGEATTKRFVGRKVHRRQVRLDRQHVVFGAALAQQHLQQITEAAEVASVEHHQAAWILCVAAARDGRGVQCLLVAIAVATTVLETKLARQPCNQAGVALA